MHVTMEIPCSVIDIGDSSWFCVLQGEGCLTISRDDGYFTEITMISSIELAGDDDA